MKYGPVAMVGVQDCVHLAYNNNNKGVYDIIYDEDTDQHTRSRRIVGEKVKFEHKKPRISLRRVHNVGPFSKVNCHLTCCADEECVNCNIYV